MNLGQQNINLVLDKQSTQQEYNRGSWQRQSSRGTKVAKIEAYLMLEGIIAIQPAQFFKS